MKTKTNYSTNSRICAIWGLLVSTVLLCALAFNAGTLESIGVHHLLIIGVGCSIFGLFLGSALVIHKWTKAEETISRDLVYSALAKAVALLQCKLEPCRECEGFGCDEGVDDCGHERDPRPCVDCGGSGISDTETRLFIEQSLKILELEYKPQTRDLINTISDAIIEWNELQRSYKGLDRYDTKFINMSDDFCEFIAAKLANRKI